MCGLAEPPLFAADCDDDMEKLAAYRPALRADEEPSGAHAQLARASSTSTSTWTDAMVCCRLDDTGGAT